MISCYVISIIYILISVNKKLNRRSIRKLDLPTIEEESLKLRIKRKASSVWAAADPVSFLLNSSFKGSPPSDC